MTRNAAPEWPLEEFSWKAATLAIGRRWGLSLIVCMTKLITRIKDIAVFRPNGAHCSGMNAGMTRS